jgi:DNA-directed RNA polymerase specialized sigma24 family protein
VTGAVDDFDCFAAEAGERLRRVLVAQHGVEAGSDVTDEALAYSWEHWDRVRVMANPIGYLYRVAHSTSRRHQRWSRRPSLPIETRRPDEPGDPGLHAAAVVRMRRADSGLLSPCWTLFVRDGSGNVDLGVARSRNRRIDRSSNSEIDCFAARRVR